jgi:single-strand DNA-binding protein
MVNKVILIGNVGADPEVRTLESGVKVATLRLATTERGKDKDGNATSHTEWHSVVVWRALADVVDRYVRKGTQLYIEGRLRTREWSTREGEKRYSVEVLCDNLQMIGKKSDSAPAPSEPAPSEPQPTERVAQAVESLQAAIDDDEIPF